eukprot:4753927-Pyramimonas_sp.AAC.1
MARLNVVCLFVNLILNFAQSNAGLQIRVPADTFRQYYEKQQFLTNPAVYFLEENLRQRRGEGGNKGPRNKVPRNVCYAHVPKTGGSAFKTLVLKTYVDRFTSKVRITGNHATSCSRPQLIKPGTLTVLTMREPAQRLYSQYLHFGQVTRSCNPRNPVSCYCCGVDMWLRQDDFLKARALYIRHKMTFVHFVNNHNMMRNQLARQITLGTPAFECANLPGPRNQFVAEQVRQSKLCADYVEHLLREFDVL